MIRLIAATNIILPDPLSKTFDFSKVGFLLATDQMSSLWSHAFCCSGRWVFDCFDRYSRNRSLSAARCSASSVSVFAFILAARCRRFRSAAVLGPRFILMSIVDRLKGRRTNLIIANIRQTDGRHLIGGQIDGG